MDNFSRERILRRSSRHFLTRAMRFRRSSPSSSLLCVRLGLVPFHYGYVVLFVATIGKIMSAPGQSPCIGVVIDAIMCSLGLSRSAISALYLVATVASAASLPLAGQLVDRFGVQRFVTITALCLGASCWLLSACRNAMLLLICFYLLRLFGQGAIFLVSVTAINLWWVKMRGLMMGIAGAGASVGITALVPVLLQHGLATVGWRQTYVVMAVCAAFGMAPLGFAFYRESPETYGMLPDAGKHAGLAASDSAAQQPENENENEAEDVDAKPSSSSSSPEDEPAWTRAEALRTAAFWSVSFGSLSVALTGTAFWFHLTAVIGERVGGTARTAGGDGFGSGDRGGSGSDHMSELGSGDGDVLAGCVSSAAPPPALMSSVYTAPAIASK